jgi:hypothetical protein
MERLKIEEGKERYYITVATSYTIEKVFQYGIFADNNEYLKDVKKGDKLILIVKEEKDFRIIGVYQAEDDGYFDDKNPIFGYYNGKVNFPFRVKFCFVQQMVLNS